MTIHVTRALKIRCIITIRICMSHNIIFLLNDKYNPKAPEGAFFVPRKGRVSRKAKKKATVNPWL